MAARSVGSSTMTKRHGWLNPTEGARLASSIRVFERAVRQRLAPEAANVSPPDQKVVQARAERVIEFGRRLRRRGGFGLRTQTRFHRSKPSGCRETRPSQSATAATPARLPADRSAARRADRGKRASECRRGRDGGTMRRPLAVRLSRNSVVPPTISRPAPFKIASSLAAASARRRRVFSIHPDRPAPWCRRPAPDRKPPRGRATP